MADFAFGTFTVCWILSTVSDFLDQSFLITIAITMYSPCVGFRDNAAFFSMEYSLVFVAASLALVIRAILAYNDIDAFRWNSYCHVAASASCFLFFIEVLIKWRRAVYGRSQLATHMGRKTPDQRAPDPTAARPALEMSAPSLAIGDVETNEKGPFAYTPKADNEAGTAPVEVSSFWSDLGKRFFNWFLLPGLLVTWVAAGDQQQATFESVQYERLDVALGASAGVICSTLLAVFAGRTLKWYFHDTHLLLYIALCFFGVMITSVQSTVIQIMLRDVPMRVTRASQQE